jgi:hypothetical protein
MLTLFAFASNNSAQQNTDLVFLGLMGNDAPAIETNFDRRLRDALAVTPDYHLADYQASMEFRRRINFDENPVVSRRLVETLRQFTNDSTVFAWAVVRENTLKPVRQWLVRSAIEGDITLTLNVYSLRFRDYTFIGDVHATFTKPKDYIFFYPLERGTHVSALDRTEITAHLIDSASLRAATMISAVVRSEFAKSAKLNDTADISKRRESGISDMFNMPSVEPATVEVGRKKQTQSPGTTSGIARSSSVGGKANADSAKAKQ